jgi:Xaa-Pro aminopeptidase
MERLGIDAIVAQSYEHVRYVSGFDNRLPFETGTGAAAILPRAADQPITLIVAMPYVSHLVLEPSSADAVAVFGSLGIARSSDADLDPPESDVAEALESWDGRSHPTKQAAIAAVLEAMQLDPKSVAIEPWGPGRLDEVDARPLLAEIRVVKTPDEIAALSKSSRMNEQAFDAARAAITVGADWREVYLAWAREWAAQGGTASFWGSGAGAHASQFYPASASYAVEHGDIVRFEGGGTMAAYWADTGRSASVGRGSDTANRRARALLAGADAFRENLRAGAVCDELCKVALQAIQRSGFPDFPASNAWGHGIGLSLNEAPRVRPGVTDRLEAGSVICFETPYFELGWGGLQLEDTYVVTADGYELLTTASAELIELG